MAGFRSSGGHGGGGHCGGGHSHGHMGNPGFRPGVRGGFLSAYPVVYSDDEEETTYTEVDSAGDIAGETTVITRGGSPHGLRG
jgi:hypothetical protein